MSVHELPALPLPTRVAADDNPHKLVARYRKARKVADALIVADAEVFTPENVEALAGNVAARTLAARLAGTRVPSEVTWALVVELLRESG